MIMSILKLKERGTKPATIGSWCRFQFTCGKLFGIELKYADKTDAEIRDYVEQEVDEGLANESAERLADC